MCLLTENQSRRVVGQTVNLLRTRCFLFPAPAYSDSEEGLHRHRQRPSASVNTWANSAHIVCQIRSRFGSSPFYWLLITATYSI